jgi:hypothetical protein
LNTLLNRVGSTFPETARRKGSKFHTCFLFANNANLSPEMIFPCPAGRLQNRGCLRCRCQSCEKKSFLIAELGLETENINHGRAMLVKASYTQSSLYASRLPESTILIARRSLRLVVFIICIIFQFSFRCWNMSIFNESKTRRIARTKRFPLEQQRSTDTCRPPGLMRSATDFDCIAQPSRAYVSIKRLQQTFLVTLL